MEVEIFNLGYNFLPVKTRLQQNAEEAVPYLIEKLYSVENISNKTLYHKQGIYSLL